jgi:preprotein translocase subunit YajC
MSIFTVGFQVWDVGFPGLVAMGAPQQGQQGLLGAAIPILLMLGIFYFLVLLPMKRKQQKVSAFLAALKVGDKVITSGGIHASITRLNEQTVQLQIANNVRIEVSRAAIIGYQGQEPVVTEGNQS